MAVMAWAANSLGNYSSLPGGSVAQFCPENNLTADLAARLSPGAKISFPGEESFAEATARWSTYSAPNITINVEVAVEQDVVETVKFANQHNKAYLAVNNRHGANNAVGKVAERYPDLDVAIERRSGCSRWKNCNLWWRCFGETSH